MIKVEIYDTIISIPNRDNKYIEDWGFPNNPSEQYWRRKPLPSFFEQVEYNKEGDALLDSRQREYAIEEVRRCKEGFWFLNNGVETYITGKNYFYIQWWKLENDEYPEFRNTDREYFLFLNHWENIPWCLGVVRSKKRREGASSQATSNLIYECIFYKNSFCGLTSKTQVDAKNTFTNLVAFGYRQLPVFLKPKQLNNKDSVSELVFAHKSVDVKGGVGRAIDNDTGHRSKVDYRAPSKNSYDSMRISRLIADEIGKFPPEVPASEFISIVSKTLVQGAKRVGFIEAPSTSNSLTNGGAEYKKIWEAADHSKGEKTPNRFVRYFSPAYQGYVGFIDKHGMSVIDSPTDEQYKYLVDNFVGAGDLTEEDIKLGAKDYLLKRRIQLEGAMLEEEIRMNPFTEKEVFMSAETSSLYNSAKINQQLDFLSYNELTERGNLIWENGDEMYSEKLDINREVVGIKMSKLVWVPNQNGKYEKVIGWTPREPNNVYERNGYFFPNSKYAIRIGCDPFKYDKTKDNRKSNCAAYAYQLEDVFDENSEFNDMFVLKYVDRPLTTDLQYDAVLKMAWYCGCQVLFERNVDGWKKYFNSKKCGGFLMWMKGEVEPGIYTDGQGKTLQQICDFTEAYIEKNIHKVYFKSLLESEAGWLGFDVGNTQKFDEAMASGFSLIAAKQKRMIAQVSDNKNVEHILPYLVAV